MNPFNLPSKESLSAMTKNRKTVNVVIVQPRNSTPELTTDPSSTANQSPDIDRHLLPGSNPKCREKTADKSLFSSSEMNTNQAKSAVITTGPHTSERSNSSLISTHQRHPVEGSPSAETPKKRGAAKLDRALRQLQCTLVDSDDHQSQLTTNATTKRGKNPTQVCTDLRGKKPRRYPTRNLTATKTPGNDEKNGGKTNKKKSFAKHQQLDVPKLSESRADRYKRRCVSEHERNKEPSSTSRHTETDHVVSPTTPARPIKLNFHQSNFHNKSTSPNLCRSTECTNDKNKTTTSDTMTTQPGKKSRTTTTTSSTDVKTNTTTLANVAHSTKTNESVIMPDKNEKKRAALDSSEFPPAKKKSRTRSEIKQSIKPEVVLDNQTAKKRVVLATDAKPSSSQTTNSEIEPLPATCTNVFLPIQDANGTVSNAKATASVTPDPEILKPSQDTEMMRNYVEQFISGDGSPTSTPEKLPPLSIPPLTPEVADLSLIGSLFVE